MSTMIDQMLFAALASPGGVLATAIVLVFLTVCAMAAVALAIHLTCQSLLAARRREYRLSEGAVSALLHGDK